MCLRLLTPLPGNVMRGVWLSTFADEKTPMKKVWCFPDQATPQKSLFVTLEGRYSDPHSTFSSFRLTTATVQRQM